MLVIISKRLRIPLLSLSAGFFFHLTACSLNPVSVKPQRDEPLHVHSATETKSNPFQNKTALKIQQLNLEIELLKLENERINQKMAHRYRRDIQLQSTSAPREPLISLTKPLQPGKLSAQLLPEGSALKTLSGTLQLKKNEIELALKALEPAVTDPADAADLMPQDNQLYHAVYVMKSREEWDQMWLSLQSQHVTDKWRGFSNAKSVYFIYVGAYARRAFAQRRCDDLQQRIGQIPMIVTGSKQQRLATLSRILKYARLLQKPIEESRG